MKSSIVKMTFLFIGILFYSNIKAQEKQGETYTITNKGTVIDVQPYIDALNKSDMKYHRLKNKRNTIVFNTGVTVELFSATEIYTTTHKISPFDYPETFDAARDVPVFSLGQNNFIMEEHHVTGKYH
jgi:hypothetical protein